MGRNTRKANIKFKGLPQTLKIKGCKDLVNAILYRAELDNAFSYDSFDPDVFMLYTSFIFDRPITVEEYKKRFINR